MTDSDITKADCWLLKPNGGPVNRHHIEQVAKDLNLEIVNEDIQPGDLYLAGRNVGVRLLTCKSVHPKRWIVPVEDAYSYDTWECYKVRKIT